MPLLPLRRLIKLLTTTLAVLAETLSTALLFLTLTLMLLRFVTALLLVRLPLVRTTRLLLLLEVSVTFRTKDPYSSV